MPKTSTHVLSTSRKHATRFLVKSFGECCGSMALTAACYWLWSHCIFTSLCPCRRSLILASHRECWTPTKVRAVTTPLHSRDKLDRQLRPSRRVCHCQGCQFGFFEAKIVIFGLFTTPSAFFYFWKKANWNLAFFGHLDFLCRFGRFKDDFGRFLSTGRFLDTASGHRIINFHWKLWTRIYNFLFCCFMLIDLQFQVTLQQNQKFREVH